MTNYKQKLANMRSRRQGLDSLVALNRSMVFTADSALSSEAYEKRAKTDAMKYALGAMQELEASYTKTSIEEGNRVRDQLKTGLSNTGIPVTFEYQGSVPLNIHIRSLSDIDLLVLHDGFVTLDWAGPAASNYSKRPGSALEDMQNLRSACELILEQKFTAATIDKTGSKSIALSGGSLQRKVDVVPSHWHDTAAYQQSGAKHDREVRVLDKHERELLTNRPFLHMRRIEEKDQRTDGGTKKVIRMLKNIKRDSPQSIKLTSYDIASLVWHLDDTKLRKPSYMELSLVAEAQKYLKFLINNLAYAKTLDVPDQSRKIIDTTEKLNSLHLLSREVDVLAADVAHEIGPVLTNNLDVIQRHLLEAKVF